jgi:trk system potassium uptake protein TrkA
MYVVVAGGGRIGATLARWLISSGHEVSVVESDPATCVGLDDALGSISVPGLCTSSEALRRAGANRADVFVATTLDDGTNLVACQLALHHFGVVRTMSVVNDDDNADLFGILGIGVAILTDLALAKLQEGFSTRGVTHLMPMTNIDGKTMVSVKIPPTAGTEERPLQRIPLPAGTLVALVITRDGSVSIPTADTSIRAGDEIVIVTETSVADDLRDTLMGSVTE